MRMGKVQKLVLTAVAALLLGLIAYDVYVAYRARLPYPDNPLYGITAEEIERIGITNGEEIWWITEEEAAPLIPLLSQVELKGDDMPSVRENHVGIHGIMFRIVLTSGRELSFAASDRFFFLDGKTFRGDSTLCDAISSIYTELFEQYTGRWPYG